jgi:hypothetical protein
MPQFVKEVKSLDGIISCLTRKHGGNVPDKGIVTIPSQSVWDDTYRHELSVVGDLTTHSCFASRSETDEWICWDFSQLRLRITHYAFRAYFMSSWVIHGSQDRDNWTEIDWRTGIQELPPKGTDVASFPVSNTGEFRFIRLTKRDGSEFQFRRFFL